MANMTDAMENEILDGLTGVSTMFSTTMALAIFTVSPTDTGSVINELSGNGYERKLLSGLFPAASGSTGSVANTSILDFATATGGAWTTATHVGIMESAVEGTDDMKVWLPLANPITIQDAQVFSYAIGKFVITAS